MNKNSNQMDYPGKNCRQTLMTTHASGFADIPSGCMFCNNMETLKQYHRKFKLQLGKTRTKTSKVIIVLFVSTLKALNIIF